MNVIMNTFDIYGLVVILILSIALPLMGIRDFRRIVRWIGEGRSGARLQMYNMVIATQWILTVVLTALWLVKGGNLSDLGLVPEVADWQWMATGVGLAAAVFMVLQMMHLLRHPDILRKMRGKMGEVALVAPQTDVEVRRFNVVSITAGICEEILYRGILFAVLAAALGTWPAVALSSLVFGLAHAYQGVSGVGKTALVGLAMALLLVFTGSLFVPILLHAVMDLTSGRLITESNRLEQVSE